MALRHKLSFVLPVLLFVALFRWQSGPDQIDQTYISLDALIDAQQTAGYRNRFQEEDAINFIRKNGSPHTFSGFNSYHLKVVRRHGPRDERIAAFLSETGQAEPARGPGRQL